MEYIASYLDTLQQSLGKLPQADIARAIDMLMQANTEGKQIFVMGNGGSAAMASHFACDLLKGTIGEGKPRFKVVSLADNVSMLTAYGNDYGYEVVFAEPLISLAQPGDVAVVISSSGNSANVVKAVDAAKARGVKTIGVTGYEGGKLRDKVDLCVMVPADPEDPNSMQFVEDGQGVILHIIFVAIRHAMQAG